MQAASKTVLREFLDSVHYVAPVMVPHSRFAMNDRSQEGGSVRQPGTCAKRSQATSKMRMYEQLGNGDANSAHRRSCARSFFFVLLSLIGS
jgi:hypothetical protein